MKIHLFEDDFVDRLAPITTCRPAYTIGCGGSRLIDLAIESEAELDATVRDYLHATQRFEFPMLAASETGSPSSDSTASTSADSEWLLNARVVPRAGVFELLAKQKAGASVAWLDGSALVAARLAAGTTGPPAFDSDSIEAWLDKYKIDRRSAFEGLELFDYPHDVVRMHGVIFNENLEAKIAAGGYSEIADGVFAAADFRPPEVWALDTKEGPILFDHDAQVGPFTVIQGPVLVGKNAKVNEHAALKHGVAMGHTTKVGGEVEASIIEPFSNKQHYGFLGHAYVGSWVNLGAGTCNSDLKNTYGTVRMHYDGVKTETGMQFMGCVLGDYVKTAINSTIFTGKTIGCCSMVYGTVTENVPAFVNYAAALGSVTQVAAEVIATMQRRMFGRRGREQQPCHVELIEEIFGRTAKSRVGIEIKAPTF